MLIPFLWNMRKLLLINWRLSEQVDNNEQMSALSAITLAPQVKVWNMQPSILQSCFKYKWLLCIELVYWSNWWWSWHEKYGHPVFCSMEPGYKLCLNNLAQKQIYTCSRLILNKKILQIIRCFLFFSMLIETTCFFSPF